MTISIRPLQVPSDFPALAELLNQAETEPLTAELLAEYESSFPKGGHLLRVVAVDEQDRICGYGQSFHFPFHKEGKFYLDCLVDQSCRGVGIGRTLAEAAEGFARDRGATLVEISVRDDDERSRAFVEVRGYRLERHTYESCLDLAGFNDSPFAGVVEAAEESGLQFFSLADRPGEATERALYELMNATVVDIPGFDNPTHRSFEEWRTWSITSSEARLDCTIIAAEGDRFVGATLLSDNQQTGAIYTSHTSVDRAYRGRRLALALKLLSIRKARQYGAPYMRTNNDSLNGPMLAVNAKLGYKREPGLWRFRKEL